MSSFLFILVAEVMSHAIRSNPNINGLKYNGVELKNSSYADDSTNFIKTVNDGKELFKYTDYFEKISGLKLNKDKCEGMWLGRLKNCGLKKFGIKWPESIRILGIHLSHNKALMKELNFEKRIDKIIKKLNFWKMRDLTLYGKTLIIKAYALSQILYVSALLPVPTDIVERVEQLVYEFLWNGKTHKVKRNIIIQSYRRGGHKMVYFRSMITAQKVFWIKKALSEHPYIWKNTMQEILNVNDLKLYLKYSTSVKHTSPSLFYQEALIAWFKFKEQKINESKDILQQGLWYNDNIKVNNETVYFKDYSDKNIFLVKHLVNKNGNFKTRTELQTEYNLHDPSLRYNSLLNAIPQKWKKKLKEANLDEPANVNVEQINVDIEGKLVPVDSLTAKSIHNHLVFKKIAVSKANTNFSQIYDMNANEWSAIYSTLQSLDMSNKAKEFCYKIFHRYLPTKSLLYKMKIIESPRCNLCHLYNQTTKHLFIDCLESINLWFRLKDFIIDKYAINLEFNEKTKLFGIVNNTKNTNEITRYIHGMKYYIYLMSLQERQLDFNDFINKIDQRCF
jgi:hypothetical protein